LRRGSLAILNEIFGRLVATVSRDALDGAEVWKTVAFMLLDAFVELAGSEANNVVIALLTQGGMLANFVQAIQRDDRRLQLLLEPEPGQYFATRVKELADACAEDFNALYVYEAQMSMLIRIAQSRQGAERLHELGILPILSRAEFIDSRPEGILAASGGHTQRPDNPQTTDQLVGDDDFLPPTHVRFHQLLMPALQVVSSLLGTLGSSHVSIGNQVT
jgi:nuclear pore complex protein Nup205